MSRLERAGDVVHESPFLPRSCKIHQHPRNDEACWANTAGRPLLPDEPITLSAPLARAFALKHCPTNSVTGLDCAWYHGLWQYLRALDLVTTPRHNADFYSNVFRSLARSKAYARVLVSGTADFGMPAHVMWSYRQENAPLALTVVDRCETPLRLTRWYAEARSVAVATTATDILEYGAESSFDVICTHSFLGRFAPDDRVALIAKWRDLLRPGGKVVTVKRVRPEAARARVRFTPEQAKVYREAVWDGVGRIHPIVGMQEALDAHLEQFISHRGTHPINSADEVIEAFRCTGFRLDRVETVRIARKRMVPIPGSRDPSATPHLQIVATRI